LRNASLVRPKGLRTKREHTVTSVELVVVVAILGFLASFN